MKSLVGLPKTLWAGDCLVKGSGVLRYCSIAFSNLSMSRSPVGLALPAMRRLTVSTTSSARRGL